MEGILVQNAPVENAPPHYLGQGFAPATEDDADDDFLPPSPPSLFLDAESQARAAVGRSYVVNDDSPLIPPTTNWAEIARQQRQCGCAAADTAGNVADDDMLPVP